VSAIRAGARWGAGAAAGVAAPRRRSALSVTRIDEPDMAAAAISGVT
jgi:hypothetical protein